MFFFGDADQLAQFYLDSAAADDGPSVPDLPFEDLNETQQKIIFTYAYRAYRTALDDYAEDSVLSKLSNYYDEMFVQLASAQPDFVKAVDNNRHVFLPDYSIENVNKYRVMAGLPPRR